MIELEIHKEYFYFSNGKILRSRLDEAEFTYSGWRYHLENQWVRVIAKTKEDLRCALITRAVSSRDELLKETEEKIRKDHAESMSKILKAFEGEKNEC